MPKKEKIQQIKGNWVIRNIADHFASVISAGVNKKRYLINHKQYEQNKNKKHRYILQTNKTFKKARKNENHKTLVEVYFN